MKIIINLINYIPLLMLPVKNLEHAIQKRCEVKIGHLLEHCDHLQNKISTIKTTLPRFRATEEKR